MVKLSSNSTLISSLLIEAFTTMSDENDIRIVRRQTLDSSGTCTKCKEKADHECMKCFGCEEFYHVINCSSGSKNQVTITFFNTWENMQRLYDNIQYICDACKQDKKLKKDIVISNRMCVIEDDLRGMKDDINNKLLGLGEMIQALAKLKEKAPEPIVPVRPTYAEKASAVIVIKKKVNGPSADMDIIYQAAVNTNAAVSKAYKNRTGDTVVVCDDEASKQSMLPILNEKMESDRFTVITPPPRRPTINIIDIPVNYSKEDLLDRVKSHNATKFTGIDLNADNFKIIFTKPQFKNNNLFKATVRVSEDVRKAISNASNKLFIGLSSCPVYDDFFVKRCNRCQQFGHWKDDCNADTPVVCGKCSGHHETKDCTVDVIKCNNCVHAKHNDTNHETSYNKCVVYIAARKKIELTINYYKNNPKN